MLGQPILHVDVDPFLVLFFFILQTDRDRHWAEMSCMKNNNNNDDTKVNENNLKKREATAMQPLEEEFEENLWMKLIVIGKGIEKFTVHDQQMT